MLIRDKVLLTLTLIAEHQQCVGCITEAQRFESAPVSLLIHVGDPDRRAISL